MLNKRTRKEWLGMVKQCEESGLSRSEWCRKHSICKSSLRYWISKVKVLSESTKLEEHDFIELKDLASESRLEIRCDGLSIFLPKDFEASMLHCCLKVLRA